MRLHTFSPRRSPSLRLVSSTPGKSETGSPSGRGENSSSKPLQPSLPVTSRNGSSKRGSQTPILLGQRLPWRDGVGLKPSNILGARLARMKRKAKPGHCPFFFFVFVLVAAVATYIHLLLK